MIARDLTLTESQVIVSSKLQNSIGSDFITESLNVQLIKEFSKTKERKEFDVFEPKFELNYLLRSYFKKPLRDYKVFKISHLYEKTTVSKINEISLNFERCLLVKPLCSNPYEFVFYLLCWNKRKDKKYEVDPEFLITNFSTTLAMIIEIYIAYVEYFESNKDAMTTYILAFQDWLIKNAQK